jgi:hypothetical protein
MFTSSSLEGKGKYCTGKVKNNNQKQTIPTLITVKKKTSKCKTGLLDCNLQLLLMSNTNVSYTHTGAGADEE